MSRLMVIALLVSVGCSLGNQAPVSQLAQPPEDLEVTQLSNREAFPEFQRIAVDAISASLLKSRENPSEFYASVSQPFKDILVFHLWHSSAFSPEYKGMFGNPGGKCRDVEFDLSTGKVVRSLFWQ